MDINFKPWLAANRAAGKGGVCLPQLQIVRGVEFEEAINILGDYSADEFDASLSMEPDPEGGPLVNFSLTVGSFAGGATPILLQLTAEQTADLPEDADTDGVVWLAFDMLRTRGGVTRRFLAGVVPVSGKVA